MSPRLPKTKHFRFDHEKLHAYQRAIEFIAWAHEHLDHLPKSLVARDQLDRAATSIPLNLAEGNGRRTATDRRRFFHQARGSALECAACLDVLVSTQKLDADLAREGKELLVAIVSMLVGLIRANSDSGEVWEEGAAYEEDWE